MVLQMYKFILGTFCALALIVALIISFFNPPPLRQFGAEPSPSPSYVTTFDEVMLQRVQNGKPLPQVKKLAVSGDDINLSRPLELMSGGPGIEGLWPTYFHGLHDGRLAAHPQSMEVAEINSQDDIGPLCGYPQGTRYPVLKYPLLCPEKLLSTPQDQVLVLPPGYTSALQQYASAHTQREGWLLASVIAAIKNSDHLRHEMEIAGVTWPENATVNEGFDYCVAGISLRAVFPADDPNVDLTALVSTLDELVYRPENREGSYAMFVTGFQAGRLDQCVPAA
jgi:hypothetical protein